MYKTILLLSSALLMAVATPPAHAQNFDTSGTASLSGPYLFRYVDFLNDTNGNLTESCSLSGVITFDGKGSYKLSNTQLFDSAGASTGTCAPLGGGTYGVQPNGIAQLDNPIFGGLPATLFGTFSQPVVIGSSTEDDYFDLFVAVQAPSAAVSNSSLSGTFTVGTLDFLNANVSLAREGYFTLTADGNGNISPFTVTGSTAAVGSGYISQNVAASTYALSGTTGGTVTFPGVSTDQTEIVAGSKVLYVSADGNWFVAGSATGSDMFFGFRAPTGTSSNATLSGTYFTAGMDANLNGSPYFLDAFYGSINTNGNGNLIWHERFDDVVDVSTYDYTFNTPITIGADGSYFDGTFSYLAGGNGTAMMLIGSGLQFSLNIGIHAPTVTPTSTVWILPTYITNAANYTPITNAFSPGELVNIYGTFGVPSQGASGLPISTTLGGVQVLVNGQAAPILSVSSSQISAFIPYEASITSSGAPAYFATFQAVVNESKSNTVTVYLDNSSPGIYTLPETGLGAGAILHSDYSLVNDSSPAKPGETVLLYMNGLGTVTPQVADGAAASGNPLSYADEYNNGYISILMDDGSGNYPPATLTGAYLGAFLAPGFAGLYQVNFTLPSALSLANGEVYLAFNTLEASNEMATISLTGFSGASAPVSSKRRPSRLRRPATAAARASKAKNHRRALPDRPL